MSGIHHRWPISSAGTGSSGTIILPTPTSERAIIGQTDNATISYSDDFGSTWSNFAQVFPDALFSRIINDKLYSLQYSLSQFYTSSDNGSSWVLTNLPGTVAGFNQLSLSTSGRLLATGIPNPAGANVPIFTSDDFGATWTVQAPIVGSGQGPRQCSWVKDRFVYLGTDFETGAAEAQYSFDGVTWTTFSRPILPDSARVVGCVYFAGMYLLFGFQTSSTVYYTTTDFITFTSRAFGVSASSTYYYVRISPDGTALLFPSNIGGVYRRTTDGINWTTVLTQGGAFRWNLTVTNSKMYALNNTTSAHVSSDQGATWSPITLPFTPLLGFSVQQN